MLKSFPSLPQRPARGGWDPRSEATLGPCLAHRRGLWSAESGATPSATWGSQPLKPYRDMATWVVFPGTVPFFRDLINQGFNMNQLSMFDAIIPSLGNQSSAKIWIYESCRNGFVQCSKIYPAFSQFYLGTWGFKTLDLGGFPIVLGCFGGFPIVLGQSHIFNDLGINIQNSLGMGRSWTYLDLIKK